MEYCEFRETLSLSEKIKSDYYSVPFNDVRPRRPTHAPQANSDQMVIYVEELKAYEKLSATYTKQWEEHRRMIDQKIKEFRDDLEADNDIQDWPLFVRNKVWYKAWEDAHSEGFMAVKDTYEDFLEIWSASQIPSDDCLVFAEWHLNMAKAVMKNGRVRVRQREMFVQSLQDAADYIKGP